MTWSILDPNGIYLKLHNESGVPQAFVMCLKRKHVHKLPYNSVESQTCELKKTFMSLIIQDRPYFLVHYKTMLTLASAQNQLPDNLSLAIPNFAHFMLPFQALGRLKSHKRLCSCVAFRKWVCKWPLWNHSYF